MADGSDLKVTEYDFPKPLLDKAKVQSLESADQPTYNDDLAKVVNQALNWEEGERKSADAAEAAARDAADKAEQKAREDADTALGERIDAEAAARESADTQLGNDIASEKTARENADTALGERVDAEAAARESADTQINNNVSAMQAQIDGQLANFVTIPTDGTPTQNMLDADLFETSEVNGDKGVTLKHNAITQEYVYGGYINQNDLLEQGIGTRFWYGATPFDGKPYAVNKFDRRFFAATQYGPSMTDLSDTQPIKNDLALIPKMVPPYTNDLPCYKNAYDSPSDNVKNLEEIFNFIDFGFLQLIIVTANITWLGAGNAFITVSADKLFDAKGDYTKWSGVAVNNAAIIGGSANAANMKYRVTDGFSPFLIAEGPNNPAPLQSAIHHDDTNGTRIQVSKTSSEASTDTVTYLLGNIPPNMQDHSYTFADTSSY